MASGGGDTVLWCAVLAVIFGVPLLGGRTVRWLYGLSEDARDRAYVHRRTESQVGRLVDDLRRLSADLARLPAGAAYARHQGTQLAYDQVLAALCHELDVDADFAARPLGWGRDMERLRSEDAIYRRGLRIHPSA